MLWDTDREAVIEQSPRTSASKSLDAALRQCQVQVLLQNVPPLCIDLSLLFKIQAGADFLLAQPVPIFVFFHLLGMNLRATFLILFPAFSLCVS